MKDKLKRRLDVLPGKKTYFIVIMAILVTALYLIGIFSEKTMEVINTFLSFLGLGTIALKIDRYNLIINEKQK